MTSGASVSGLAEAVSVSQQSINVEWTVRRLA
jgi:hypothetical protein